MKTTHYHVLLLLVMTCHVSISIAQKTYAPLNAKWSYEGYSVDCSGFHQTFRVENEISVNGKDCSVIYAYLSTNAEPEPVATGDTLVVWENEKRIYFLEQDSFYLFYDFNVGVGDTLVYYDPIDRGLFSNYVYDTAVAFPYEFHMVVTDIEGVEIDGVNLRKYRIEGVGTEGQVWPPDTIIEGIGSISEKFSGFRFVHIAEGCIGYLVCYENEELKYMSSETDKYDCDFVSAVHDTRAVGRIKIYPNPARETIFIDTPDPTMVSSIVLFNSALQEVSEVFHTNRLFINQLPLGIYIMLIDFGKHGKQIRKIVIQ